MTPTGKSSIATLWQTATRCHQAGQLGQAEAYYRHLLEAEPNHADALHLLGVLLGQTGRRSDALIMLRKAVALRPDQAGFWCNLGELSRQEGQLQEAEDCLQKAAAIQPLFPEAHFNLGNVHKAQNRLEEAIASYRRAVEQQPRYTKAYYNLANALRATGRIPWAIESYRQAVTLRPDYADAWMNLGVAHLEVGDTAAAIDCFHRVRQLAPAHLEIDENLANAYLKQGKLAEAREHFGRALSRQPNRWLGRFRMETLAEPIPSSNDAIDEYRLRLAETLKRYAEDHPPLDLSWLTTSGAEPPTALVYQGRDDLPLNKAYAKIFARVIPPLEPCSGSGKPHVGFVVTPGHEGVFTRCLGGLIECLSPARLRVSLVSTLAGVTVLRHLLPRYGQEFLALPSQLPDAAERLREAGVDLLHYWEVGTDSLNYFLPFFRPAPRQSATWGWPITSGNPRIDYFVSSGRLEPEGGAEHYTEQLVRLNALPTYYYRPPVPKGRPQRDRWGLSDSTHLYFCTQNLRKYHPDFDPVLADVLRADPAGQLLLIADEQPTVTELLLARFRRNLPDVLPRIRTVPRMEREEYLQLVTTADVILDTLHYGGGANSVYDAVATGTPFVTLPGKYHRGRYAAAVCELLEMPELVVSSPADYVQRAVRIACEPDFRRELSHQLQARSALLFEDAQAVRELEEWCLRVIEESRSAFSP